MTHSYPVVILLTHRRGVGLAILKAPNDPSPILTRSTEKTAESLYDVFTSGLKLAGLCLQDIKTLAVGVGPGSFTGLRLGCAFANGLKLGHNCRLIPIQTELSANLLASYPFENEEDKQEFLKQLGDVDETDESSGLITFYDLHDALEKLKSTHNDVPSLEPQYGREPGPVLKLKGIAPHGS